MKTEDISVTVKMLNSSSECRVQLHPHCSIANLKEHVSKMLHVPIAAQKLTFRGKVLNDLDSLQACGISQDSKVHLIKVAMPDNPLSAELLTEMKLFLRPHFAEPDCRRIIDSFQKNTSRCIEQLSLDDIERIAWQRLDA